MIDIRIMNIHDNVHVVNIDQIMRIMRIIHHIMYHITCAATLYD